MRVRLCITAAAALVVAQAASAQAPSDTPSIKVGATIFADFTYTSAPLTVDADSNRVHLTQFNVGRAYINVTGNISRWLTFRITPDIVRETGTGTTLNGSLDFRLKYTYAQVVLESWSKGAWFRLGIQQTPWVDFEESVYRYRYQGPVFADREGYMSSADAGASFHYNLPASYGDVHLGVYNGETFSRPETNDQKSFQGRASVRPFAGSKTALKGIRASGFFNFDHYVRNAPRNRFIGALTFEHPRVHAGLQMLKTSDQTTSRAVEVEGKGFSAWLTPRSRQGWEALLRVDRLKPNSANTAQRRNRNILGLAYWLPHLGNVSAAFMLDYEQVQLEGFTPVQPTQNRISVHSLVNF